MGGRKKESKSIALCFFFVFGFAYHQGKDIVFRFIIEYSTLRGFYMPLGNNNNNTSIFI
jgi:hypothetical protein